MKSPQKANAETEGKLAEMGDKYFRLLIERAKDGDKSLNGQSSIQALLWIADDAIACLRQLALHKPEICSHHAKARLNWPAWVSTITDTERKWQDLKKKLPLKKENTQQNDTLFKVARFARSYFSDHHGDSYQCLYFATFIKGIERMPRVMCVAAVESFVQRHGLPSKTNWDVWKPIFERFVTLNYGPAAEKWELFPENHRDNVFAAEAFSVVNQYLERAVKLKKISAQDRAKIKETVFSGKTRRPCLMDLPHTDEAMKNLRTRAKGRAAGWGDYKAAILKRCLTLLPKH